MKKWIDLSRLVLDRFKGRLLRVALLKIASYIPASISGPIGWIARMLIVLLFDKTIKPLFELTIQKIYKKIFKRKIKKQVKKYENSDNESDFDSNFDNLD